MKRIFLLLFFPLLFSFTVPAGESFEKSGVSFSVPIGWKITDQEDFDGKGYYLSCEKAGDNSSGLVTVSWVNDSLDLSATTENYASNLEKSYILKHAQPKLASIKKTTFNGIRAMSIDYTLNMMNVAHEGHIYCFYGNNKTITVMIQEALEDKAANRLGLQEITRSFTCR